MTLQGQILVRNSFVRERKKVDTIGKEAIGKAQALLDKKLEDVRAIYGHATQLQQEMFRLEAELAGLQTARAGQKCFHDQLVKRVRGKPVIITSSL